MGNIDFSKKAPQSHLGLLVSSICVVVASFAGASPSSALPTPINLNDAYMYALDDNNNIYQVNPELGTSTLVNPLSSFLTNSEGSNGVAYDQARNHLYFFYDNGLTDPNYKLYFWDRQSQGLGSIVELASGATTLKSPYSPANAAYANNSLYYFTANNNSGSSDLIKADLDFTTTIPTISSVTATPVPGFPAMDSAPNTNGFGDIAYNVANSTLYGSRNNGEFFSIDSAGNYSLIASSSGISGGLQLSFDATYSKLYGHSRTLGSFYEVDVTSGQVGSVIYSIAAPGFRDLGGASLAPLPPPEAVPAPIPVLGTGLAMLSLRRLRKLSSALNA